MMIINIRKMVDGDKWGVSGCICYVCGEPTDINAFTNHNKSISVCRSKECCNIVKDIFGVRFYYLEVEE